MTRTFVLMGLGLVMLAFVAAGLGVQPPGSHGHLNHGETVRYVVCALAAAVPYAAAVWLVRARPVAAWAVWGIVAIGLAARLLAWWAPPALSTDIYRYVWDGRVQAAGINPYLFVPADPALQALRDAGTGPGDIFGNINRADFAPTIYPPAAQALFALMGVAAPGVWAMKAAMLGFDLAAGGMLLLLLRAARLPSACVLVWAWHPLVIWELANEGHIDAASIAFSGLALLMAARRNPAAARGIAGAALGVAVLLKLLPAALFPAIWRRWDLRAPLAAAAVILAGYACYAGAGWKLLGYLPGYAAEEGEKGFYLFQLIELAGPLPRWAATGYAAFAAVVLGGAAVFVAFRPGVRDAGSVCRDALILSAALLTMVSPHYPWYLTMLVLPAAVVPAWSALWPTLAGPLMYLDHDLWVVLPAIPLLAVDLYLRRRPGAAVLAHGGR